MPLLPKSFRFSPLLTIFAIALAALMLRASAWQWERYKFKKELEETYAAHSSAAPLNFPSSPQSASDHEPVMNRKVVIEGTYDFEHQMLIRNRRHASGPGFWLVTPFKIKNSSNSVLVSRGFIPFEDGESAKESKWRKYDNDTAPEAQILAVVQATVPKKTVLSPDNPGPTADQPFVTHWLYMDVAKMAEQLPYPIIPHVYLQRLGGPAEGEFPAEAISISVPPSTHFGYTFEWIILAFVTLLVAFLLQAFPRTRKRPEEKFN